MDGKQAKRTALLWLLVLVAVVFLWWFLRPKDDAGTTAAQLEADRIAALGADPDEIIVDLRDDASAAAVAALEQRFGLDLVLISDQADDEQVYRAKVDPARRDWVLAALAKTAGVEVAEPDATFALSPTEVRGRRDRAADRDLGRVPRRSALRQAVAPASARHARGVEAGRRRRRDRRRPRHRRRPTRITAATTRSRICAAWSSSSPTTSSTTTPTPTTTTATAPTSPARSPRRPTTARASPAWPATSRSCRSRSWAATARARWPASPTPFATPPTTAPRSST
jgi:hypothetical protein